MILLSNTSDSQSLINWSGQPSLLEVILWLLPSPAKQCGKTFETVTISRKPSREAHSEPLKEQRAALQPQNLRGLCKIDHWKTPKFGASDVVFGKPCLTAAAEMYVCCVCGHVGSIAKHGLLRSGGFCTEQLAIPAVQFATLLGNIGKMQD